MNESAEFVWGLEEFGLYFHSSKNLTLQEALQYGSSVIC